jgi:transposase
LIKLCPLHTTLDKIDIWFQDEARFGQQNTTTRLWATKGSRPRAVRQQQFDSAYLFGAVCPATGATEALIAPWVNKEIMTKHLEQISKRTPQGRMAVVIMDGASWHSEDTTIEFENVRILKLPPYSPELNPIEQVWSWLRQHHLANRVFSGYEDIVDACSKAWVKAVSLAAKQRPPERPACGAHGCATLGQRRTQLPRWRGRKPPQGRLSPVQHSGELFFACTRWVGFPLGCTTNLRFDEGLCSARLIFEKSSNKF